MAAPSEPAARGIRRLTLPGGALTLADAHRLERAARALREDRDARVVLVDSAGPDFCPGLPDGWDPRTAGVDAAAALAAIRCPTIAVLEGRVASLGLELALACDLRVAGEGTRFALPEVPAGRLPCWGATQRLPRAAGALAERLLALGPLALELVKEAVGRGADLPMRAALELEGDFNHLLQPTADRAEGLAAFAQKRPPAFTGT